MFTNLSAALTLAAAGLAFEGLTLPSLQADVPALLSASHDQHSIEQRREYLLVKAIPLAEQFYKDTVELAPQAAGNEQARDKLVIHSQYDLGKSFFLMSETLRASGRQKEADLWRERGKEVSDIWANAYLRTALSEDGYGKIPEQFFVTDSRWIVFRQSVAVGHPDPAAWADVMQGAHSGAFGHPATNPEWLLEVKQDDSTHRAIAHAIMARLHMLDVLHTHPQCASAAIAKALPRFSKLEVVSQEERDKGAAWAVTLYEIGLKRLSEFKPEKESGDAKPKELVLPYMTGRLCEAVLQAYDLFGNTPPDNRQLGVRVAEARTATITVVAKALEKLETYWQKDAGGYQYANLKYPNGDVAPAPALNGFISVPAAHLFRLTQDPKFKKLALRDFDACMKDGEADSPGPVRCSTRCTGLGLRRCGCFRRLRGASPTFAEATTGKPDPRDSN